MNTLRQPVMVCGLVVPVTLSFALLLGGCGSDPQPAAVATVPDKPASEVKPVDPTARMARAVGDDKPGAAVSIKYDLSIKPQVGVPLEVKVVFLPSIGVEALDATFSGMEGISLSGNLNASFTGVKSGQLYEHGFTVLPERNGMFYVTVNASTRFGGSTMGRTFAIPFVVGDQSAQPKPAPQKDANGQPIQPMKATEPR
jgi:hypothetical protein